ncbi:peroxiredoxin-like family protein [Amycolatopsis suaedae]|uniref:AhpC/TSA family protein n=1 Tax=Amycolatopsis suaedae TaxID=2510978 RepID=A0A4Q7J5H7_9PSEU|nr:peroxiredoxin-like family protein [Amycolatopsis suaedae]RZQ62841.1 AhpC/TSA family protein [Amycolatopsis suaedae]
MLGRSSPVVDVVSIAGVPVRVPDPDRVVHLQFRRFAGCPVCNVHLRSFAVRQDEITAAGVREVVVFHSPADQLREQAGDLPFDLVADPDQDLYRTFGVTSARRALLDPRAWPGIARAVAVTVPAVLRRRVPAPPPSPHGGRLGLPADFLIGADGTVLAVKYGEHANDQWSVAELLTLVRQEVPVR